MPGDKVEAKDNSSLTSEKKLMTSQEVADMFQVSKRTVERLTKKGAIRCIKIGRGVRFDRDDIDKWLRKKPRSLNVS